MNTKRFIPSIIAVFTFIFIYEWILHGYLLAGLYESTPSLWRSKTEMPAYLIWLMLGQLFFTIMFCYIFLKGYENKGLMEGVRYGILIGLLFIGPDLVFYAVQPLPAGLVVYWCIGGLIEMIIAGVILASIYRPAAS
ncbi:MAG: hypothetical protein HY356_01745 [Gammaproteobacteria bacterium]|nr:hypothetical protein [Gammaproteobacteria bacterium]